MRFLADESCDSRVVQALRAAGHDVLAVVEASPGAPDASVLEEAHRSGRILLTEDRDFGRLVHAGHGPPGQGVLLLRCPEPFRGRLAPSVVMSVARAGERLRGRFAVWTPGRLRLR